MQQLSSQQRQIWQLHEQGYGAKRIAKILGISVDQVKVQLRRVKAKVEGGNKNINNLAPGVNRALEGLEEMLPKLETRASQIDFLTTKGYRPGEIAELLGTTLNAVRVQKYRNKQQSFRGGIKRSFLTREQLEALPGTNIRLDLDLARLLYLAFVQSDNLDLRTLAFLGTQGLGGWQAKKIVLTKRAGVLKALAVSGREKGRVIRITNKKGPWWEMIKDLVERYKLVGADTYLPDSLKAFASELQDRIEAALDGVRIEVKENREGTKVYEVVGGFTAVAIRPLVNQAAIIVSANLYGTKLGAKQYEGTVTFDQLGLKVSGRDIENFRGIVFRNQGKDWFTMETRLLQAGDKVQVRSDLYGGQVLEVVSWRNDIPLPRVVCLGEEDLALAVAAFKIKEDCFIEIAGRVFDCRETGKTRMAM
ncbi:MAG: helix-turn-helix transcriptional regulator [Moorellaceae bacterium]